MTHEFSDPEERGISMPQVDWRTRAYAVGGVIGAVVGLGAAYLYVNANEQGEQAPEMKPGEMMAIGLAVLALLRQIAGLPGGGEPSKKKRR